jgi:hypothetical protein
MAREMGSMNGVNNNYYESGSVELATETALTVMKLEQVR